MFIRVREGVFGPQNGAGEAPLEPKGHELWAASIDDLSAAALHAAGVSVDPGEWYSLEEFKRLIEARSDNTEAVVFSAVSAPQAGVGKPWIATIEVAEQRAALMVCSSVVEHIERLGSERSVWIRVE